MKMKLKDKLVLEALTKAIYALDSAAQVFKGAAEELKELKEDKEGNAESL